MADDLMRQAAELERARAADRGVKKEEAERRAAEYERRKLVHLEADIERQLTEIAAFTADYLGSRGIEPKRLCQEQKSYDTYRDPDSYEYQRRASWVTEYEIAHAWLLLDGAMSADGSWWWQSEDRQSETRRWYSWSISDVVGKLSKHGECTLGEYRVRVVDEGDGQAVLMANIHGVDAVSRFLASDQPDRKLRDIVVEEVVNMADRHAN